LEGNPVVVNNKNDDNNNATASDEANHLLALLVQNAELCCLGENINWQLPLYQTHSDALRRALDDNFARILKTSSSSCPLALWSNVLQCAAANNNNHGRNRRNAAKCKKNNADDATLIYNVLQGPAFVERLPHSY
jgi:hypothetical protein